MNPELLQEMKVKLEIEKQNLETELSKFSHRNQNPSEIEFKTDFPNIGDKEDENASEVAQFSDNLSLEGELEKGLRDVEKALELIASGKYGKCKYCNTEIDERRLMARPTSTSCIQCKKTLTQEV